MFTDSLPDLSSYTHTHFISVMLSPFDSDEMHFTLGDLLDLQKESKRSLIAKLKLELQTTLMGKHKT